MRALKMIPIAQLVVKMVHETAVPWYAKHIEYVRLFSCFMHDDEPGQLVND